MSVFLGSKLNMCSNFSIMQPQSDSFDLWTKTPLNSSMVFLPHYLCSGFPCSLLHSLSLFMVRSFSLCHSQHWKKKDKTKSKQQKPITTTKGTNKQTKKVTSFGVSNFYFFTKNQARKSLRARPPILVYLLLSAELALPLVPQKK